MFYSLIVVIPSTKTVLFKNLTYAAVAAVYAQFIRTQVCDLKVSIVEMVPWNIVVICKTN